MCAQAQLTDETQTLLTNTEGEVVIGQSMYKCKKLSEREYLFSKVRHDLMSSDHFQPNIAMRGSQLRLQRLNIVDCTWVLRQFSSQLSEGSVENRRIRKIHISNCDMFSSLTGLGEQGSKLESIAVSNCKCFNSLRGLPRQLKELKVEGCKKLENIDVEFDYR